VWFILLHCGLVVWVEISRPSTDRVTLDKDLKELEMLSQKSFQCVEKMSAPIRRR
jgi:hypothetical protein